jgi:hypothetical protein
MSASRARFNRFGWRVRLNGLDSERRGNTFESPAQDQLQFRS